MENSFDWVLINKKGQLETGLFVSYKMKPEFSGVNKYPETMVEIHCFGSDGTVSYINARFYFKGEKYSISDGFFHWVSDDVRLILEKKHSISVPKEFIMHAEYYSDVKKYHQMVPFTLGDYALL